MKVEDQGLGRTAQRLDIKCRNELESVGNRKSLKVQSSKSAFSLVPTVRTVSRAKPLPPAVLRTGPGP